MQLVTIYNQSRPLQTPIQAQYCDSFFCRLRGLMFEKSLGTYEGLLMVQPTVTLHDAAIHMLFMNFDITVVWASDNLQVVDAALARRWRLAYVPKKPARYVLEIHPDRLADFHVGDQLVLKKC
jgi:uncharacterized membrane protein (UPF0127 family)